MTKAVQRRKGTDSEHSTFTGLEAEITVNSTNKSVHVHDGSTAGGFELARADGSNVDDFAVGGNLTVTGNTTINGTLTLGDADTDSITINADLTSNLIPNADDTYDIGSATKEWKDIYIDGTAYIDALNFNGTAITATGAELNYVDGVTSAIQTQIDGKQDSDAQLTDIAGLTPTDGNFIVGDGANFVAESGATARTSLGLGSIATQDSSSVSITGGSIDGVTIGGSSAGAITGTTITANTSITGTLATAAQTNITSVGALNGGSITSGFGSIDVGSSAITTTGTVTGGTLAGTLSTAAQPNITSVGTLTTFTSTGIDDNATSTAITIDSSQNVGIGTNIPVSEVHIASVSPILTLQDTNSTEPLSTYIDFLDSAGNEHGWIGYGSGSLDTMQIANGYDDIIFFTGTDGTTSERMRIDSSAGNVGIGTSSPLGLLEINGGTGVSTSGGTLIVRQDGDASTDGIALTSSNAISHRIWKDVNGKLNIGPSTLPSALVQDTSGNLLVGKTTGGALGTAGIELRPNNLYVTSNSSVPIYANRNTNDGTIVDFRKDGTSVGSIAVDSGALEITGTSAINLNNGTNEVGFGTGAIAGNGAGNDDVIDLGRSNRRFKDIYATNGTIQTSDRNEKQDEADLSDAETRVAVTAKGLLKKFRWKSAVEEKGDEARVHFGIIAQDLQDAFTAEGLDASVYAMFINSEWWESYTDVPAIEAQEAVLDEDGNVVTEAVEAKEAYTRTDTYETEAEAPEGAIKKQRMGVRYSELLAFIIAGI